MKILILVVLIFWSNLTHATTKAVCELMREEANDIQPQLPIDVDYSTVLLGITVIYSSSICQITYKYIIDSQKYAHFLSSENGLTERENALFILSTEGKVAIEKQFQDMGKIAKESELGELAKHPGIKLIYRHEFDDPAVGIFETTAVDTTK